MSFISPCLWFDHQAEEAAAFYVDVFKACGQEAAIGEILHYVESSHKPAGSVMVVNFTLAGQDFIALNGGPQFPHSPAISLFVKCQDQQEVDQFWQKLSYKGKEVQCGWLTDQFGVSWQIVPAILTTLLSDPDKERARRVTEAMLKMVKLDIAALKAAYNRV